MEYQNRPVTSNALVIKENKVLLIKRLREPFKDYYAIPGGFVEINESTKSAALRELKEETGVIGKIIRLVGVYDDPERDPNRYTVNVCYLVEVVDDSALEGNDDAREAKWFLLDELPPFAFDHAKQIADALIIR